MSPRVGCLVCVVLLTGCRGEPREWTNCDPTVPGELSAARRDSLQPADESLTPDTQWAAIARSTPGGFAGIYFLPGRGYVIRLTRPTERTQALRALLPRLTRSLGGVLLDSADVSVEPAHWDFAQLDEWRRYLDNRIGGPGLQSLSTDPIGNEIRYGVTSTAARSALERRLRELRVPCGLVRVEVEPIARTM